MTPGDIMRSLVIDEAIRTTSEREVHRRPNRAARWEGSWEGTPFLSHVTSAPATSSTQKRGKYPAVGKGEGQQAINRPVVKAATIRPQPHWRRIRTLQQPKQLRQQQYTIQ